MPSPLPDPKPPSPTWVRRLAAASWISFLIAILGGNRILELVDTERMRLILQVRFATAGALAGLISGVVALSYGRGYAPKGVRKPSVIGIVLSVVAFLIAVMSSIVLGGMADEPREAGSPASSVAPLRSDAELEVALQRACSNAVERGAPVLLEFSADWCGDCRRLAELKTESVLASELAEWEPIVVNVGEFDTHNELITDFDVQAISKWVALRPSDCATEPSDWARLGARTLEPATGESITAKELASWLSSLRS